MQRQAVSRRGGLLLAVILVASALGGCAEPTAGYGVAATPYAPAEIGPGYYDNYYNNGLRYDPGFEGQQFRDNRYQYRPDYGRREAYGRQEDYGRRDSGNRENGGRAQPGGQPIPFIPNDSRDNSLAGPNPGPRGQ